MTLEFDDKNKVRRFVRTIDVLTAAAEADLVAETLPIWQPAFEVVLLAAAGEDGIQLPESEILSEGCELSVLVTPEDEQLQLKLQLQGFATLDQFGGRDARLVSSDGSIDYRFRFSTTGSALCILSDHKRIRDALHKFAVYFLEGGAPAAPELS